MSDKSVSFTLVSEMTPVEINQLEKLNDTVWVARGVTNPDSINGLINQANSLRGNHPNRALEIAQCALRLAQVAADPEGILGSYASLAAIYGRLSDYDQAMKYAFAVIQLSQEQGNSTQHFQGLNFVGVFYSYLGLYPEALHYLLQAQTVAEGLDEMNYRTAAANNIGWLYLKLGQLDEARLCFESTLPLVIAHHKTRRQADYHDNLSQVYQGLGQFDVAHQHSQQSIALYQQLNSLRGEAEAWTTLGQLHLKQAAYDEAVVCLQNALDFFHQVDNPQGIAAALTTLGQIYQQQGQLDLALTYLHEALTVAESIKAQREQYESHETLSLVYQTIGDFSSALHHYQQFHQIKETLFNEQADNRLKSLEIRYQVAKAQQEAQALQRENEEHERYIVDLDAFAHTVAHDLKSPLGIIAGYSEMMLEDFAVLDAAAHQSILETIWKTSRKMVRIVDDLLTLAQVQRQTINPVPLDMAAIWNDTLARLHLEIEAHQATLHQPDTWPIVSGYASWVEEVWANYLINALRYGGRPPIIQVGADLINNNMVRFWIQDNGDGLDEAAQAKLFRDFSRLDNQQSKGHGLGLSIVKRIVERLGGTVGVDSTPGQGSTFSFTLPLFEPA